MPKIIKDLDIKIFNVAFDLFGQHGYKNVDMKMIAKEVGIAVGTLYNYYPNKKKIFMDVFEKSWEGTFFKLEKVVNQDISCSDKMIIFINTLYNEIENRKGLGGELFREKVFEEDYKLYIKNELTSKLDKLIKELLKEKDVKVEKYIQKRIVITILVTLTHIRTEYPDEREKNIKFIITLIEHIYM